MRQIMFSFGIATINFNCSYRIEELPGCEVYFEIKQEWRALAFMSIILFLPMLQPEKEWVDIENFTYFNETDQEGVELFYKEILQKHNVRVVLGGDSKNEEVVFRAACKFIGGRGVLEECGLTKDTVVYGEGHWQVELVDGG